MTTSGVYTFSRNRNQIITDAARKIGAIAAGETADSDTVTDFAAALNGLVKHWQGTGLYIWTMAEATLFLQADQTSYSLSSTSTDHCTESFVQTSIGTAGEASGQTVISVTSSTGMTAADHFGVQLDDGSMHWTTISTVDSAIQVTIALALTDEAAAGNLVVSYTTKIERPLAIVSARRFRFSGAIDVPMEVASRETYFDLPDKTNAGNPNILFYTRRGGANASGLAYIWQPQTTPSDAVKFTWMRPIQYFFTAANTPDFPDEWVQTLIFNLALVMAPEYDVTSQKFTMIKGFADKYLAEMQWNERELGTIEFVPDMRGRR